MIQLATAILSGNESNIETQINQFWESTIKTLKPDNFTAISPENKEIQTDIDFQNLCHALNEHTSKDPKNMTVFEFYSLLNYVKRKTKPQKQKEDLQ